MKQPLALVAIVYTAGLLAAELWPLRPSILFPVTLSVAVLTIFTFYFRRFGALPGLGGAFQVSTVGLRILPLLFLAGWTNLSYRSSPVSPRDLRSLHLDTELVTIRGVLPETPSQRLYIHEDQPSYRFLATVHVSHLRRNTADWQPAHGNLLVLTPGMRPPHFFAGQQVEISGVLAKPPGPITEGLFDYRAYLRRQCIYYQLKTDATNDWSLLSETTQPPFSDRFLAWAQNTLARGLPDRDEALDMLWSMTLGWKTVDNRIYEPFMQSGTMHIFAVSGLHIALIAGIFVALLRVLQLPRLVCGFIVVPLIWFYTAATGWQPSAIRSTIMMTIIIGGWTLSRPTNLLNSLAASAFVILIWDPQQLFGASFQLSFFVVLSIALLLPRFERIRDNLLQTDPLLPQQLVPRWKKMLLKPARWLATSLAISLASWLGSLPLTAYYFHLFSPVTLLANLLIVPISSCALAANLASLVCGTWFSAGSELFNYSAWFCMQSMISLSKVFAQMPGGHSYVHAPSLLVTALFYTATIALLAGQRAMGTGTTSLGAAPRVNRKIFTCRRLLAPLAAVSAALLYTVQCLGPARSATITIVPLSGGFCVYTHHPRLGRDILVDCGSSNAVQFTTTPFLRARGVDRLPALLLTHGDIRHTGGAGLLAAQFDIGKILASPVRFRSSVYRQVIQRFNQSPHPVQTLSRDCILGPWTVLHPEATDRFPRADDNALVIAAELHGSRIILLSDLGQSGQAALLDRFPELRADILVTGLPTIGEPLGRAFLERLQPQLIIVADCEFPTSERASAKLRERLTECRIPVLYTRLCGAVTFDFQQESWRLRTISGIRTESPPHRLKP